MDKLSQLLSDLSVNDTVMGYDDCDHDMLDPEPQLETIHNKNYHIHVWSVLHSYFQKWQVV